MNIFASHLDPTVCAKSLDDARVIKMTLETAQMMSTILRGNGVLFPNVYRSTHAGHKCTVWAGLNQSNFTWLGLHGLALADEHQRRFPKSPRHKSARIIEQSLELSYILPAGDFTAFANAARREDLGIDFTGIHDPVTAYRYYLNARWFLDQPRFTNSAPPDWYSPCLSQT